MPPYNQPPSQPPSRPPAHSWRKPLLITEFTALAVLVGSMFLIGRLTDGGVAVHPLWLVVPAIASLAVFVSFIGLMYLRWVVAADAERLSHHKIIFALLAITLLGVWVYGIANTWISISSQ